MGTVFGASASPLLDKLIYEVTSLVKHPKTDSPIRDTWDGKIGSMGSGSDFTAFQDFAGVPSLDFGFGRSLKDPVYHYHSNYDSFSWMDKFGDKHWQYHVSITKVYALLAAKLSESPIIPLNTTDYAKKLAKYLDKVIDKAKDSNMYETEDSIAFRDVEESIKRLLNNSISFDEEIKELQEKIGVHVPWWKWWKKVKLYLKVRKVNEKLKLFERQFLYSPGLDSRPWFKHVVFAPGYVRSFFISFSISFSFSISLCFLYFPLSFHPIS